MCELKRESRKKKMTYHESRKSSLDPSPGQPARKRTQVQAKNAAVRERRRGQVRAGIRTRHPPALHSTAGLDGVRTSCAQGQGQHQQHATTASKPEQTLL
jgi:hypothetical protein